MPSSLENVAVAEPPVADSHPEANPLSSMGYDSPDLIASMGYVTSREAKTSDAETSGLGNLPKSPAATAELFKDAEQPAVQPESESAPTPDDQAAQSGVEQRLTSTEERVGSLEDQFGKMLARLDSMTASRPSKAVETFMQKVSGQAAKIGENITQRVANSNLVRKAERFGRAAKRGYEAFNDVYAARDKAAQSFDIKDGEFKRVESPVPSPSASPVAERQAAPEATVAEAPKAEAVAAEVKPVAEPAVPESVAPERPVEQRAETTVPPEQIQAAYERIQGDPESLKFIGDLHTISEKYGLSQEFIDAALAEKFGEDAVEAVRMMTDDSEELEFMEELGGLGLSANGAVGRALSERYGTAVTEQPAAAAEKASGRRGEAPQTEAQVAAETKKTRELSEAERAERQRLEFRELITGQRGRSESDLSPSRQRVIMGMEMERLRMSAEQTPPESIGGEFTYDISQKGPDGTVSGGMVTHEYAGKDLDRPEAIKAAMADKGLKLKVFEALAKSQAADTQDKLGVFEQEVGQALGDPGMVQLRRGDQGGEPVQEFVPGQTNLIMTYEDGHLVLDVRPLAEGRDGKVKPANQLDSSFKFKS